MKYPIGIQTFAKIRDGGFAYIDKTALVYKLANEGQFYFLSRPRRFGKSLLISTLEAYFSAERKLFAGLAMEKLETEWKRYPVLHFDLGTVSRAEPDSLDLVLDDTLQQMEKQYGVEDISPSLGVRFTRVLRAAHEKTQRQAVVLIDEYDKPMLNKLENHEQYDDIRDKMKGFYSVLKKEDRHIRFALLTGVSRFSKVSVFSDLNNLNDISMASDYAGLCGISDAELHSVFDEGVAEMAERIGMTKQECYDELRRRYDGYCFVPRTERLYNPFSVLSALSQKDFGSYWFSKGTPTFLLSVMKRTGFDLSQGFSQPVSEAELADVDTVERSPLPILFQSGYLTIKVYDPRFRRYVLDFPNEEVRGGFVNCLLPYYTNARNGFSLASELIGNVESGNAEGIIDCLRTLFDKSGNYMLYEEKSKERDFRNIVYMVFALLGLYTEAELCTAHGRMDICCQTTNYVYIFELKMDISAEEAIRQIDSSEYATRFIGDKRKLVKIGVSFSSKTNSIADYIIA